MLRRRRQKRRDKSSWKKGKLKNPDRNVGNWLKSEVIHKDTVVLTSRK